MSPLLSETFYLRAVDMKQEHRKLHSFFMWGTTDFLHLKVLRGNCHSLEMVLWYEHVFLLIYTSRSTFFRKKIDK